jgi:Domain of unknown function (DUF4124)
MKTGMSVLTGVLFAGMALTGEGLAGEVYVTRDKQGNPVYTDRPDTLPARTVGITSASTDPAEVQARYSEEQKKFAEDEARRAVEAADTADAAKAREQKAADRARRCTAARDRYQALNDSWGLYEEGPDGERRYLSDEEIDAARARAKQTVDEFCGAD